MMPISSLLPNQRVILPGNWQLNWNFEGDPHPHRPWSNNNFVLGPKCHYFMVNQKLISFSPTITVFFFLFFYFMVPTISVTPNTREYMRKYCSSIQAETKLRIWFEPFVRFGQGLVRAIVFVPNQGLKLGWMHFKQWAKWLGFGFQASAQTQILFQASYSLPSPSLLLFLSELLSGLGQ